LPEVILTTNPGIEDISAEEAKAKLDASIVEEKHGQGRTIIEVEEDKLDYIPSLSSIHRALLLLARAKICPEKECLNEIRAVVSESSIADYLTPTGSFAVRVNRVGEHSFRSLDAARVAGEAIIEHVLSTRGWRPKVDLDYPSTVIHIDIIG
jgi:tRNA (guanine6-N2)-methyltransferase